MRKIETSIYRLHPRIQLEACAYCGGTGSYQRRIAGKIETLPCTQCAGHGTIVTDSISALVAA